MGALKRPKGPGSYPEKWRDVLNFWPFRCIFQTSDGLGLRFKDLKKKNQKTYFFGL